MGMTVREAAAAFQPPVTPRQARTLAAIADLVPTGKRHTGRSGRPPDEYDEDALRHIHAEEAERTLKHFTDNDWIASALLARNLIRADTMRGYLWWPDGSRAEILNAAFYGEVKAGGERVAAHRVLWIAAEGEIPPAMQVNHRNRLKWDNRRENLELVSFGNNIRHAHGTPYHTYHQAIHELTQLPPPGADVQPWEGLPRSGGVFRVGSRRRHGGN